MRFAAIDVETANGDMASICAVGAAVFEQGRLSSEWYSLVDPEDHFEPINVSIHGIDESMVSGATVYKDRSWQVERPMRNPRTAMTWAEGQDDVMGPAECPLAGWAVLIYEIITADEDIWGENERP